MDPSVTQNHIFRLDSNFSIENSFTIPQGVLFLQSFTLSANPTGVLAPTSSVPLSDAKKNEKESNMLPIVLGAVSKKHFTSNTKFTSWSSSYFIYLLSCLFLFLPSKKK